MKRIRIILGFLLLGAIVNIGVAWGCSVWIVTPPAGMQTAWVDLPGLTMPKGWSVSRKEATGAIQLIAMVRNPRKGVYANLDVVLPAWSDLVSQMEKAAEEARRESVKPENADIVGTVSPTVLMQKAYGFPFRSMYWNWDGGIRVVNPVQRDPVSRGIDLKVPPTRLNSISLDDQRALPLGVLPIGFMANSMLYAVILWLLWFGLFGWYLYRRNRRRELGLCIHCAYDLRGSTPESMQCPECGRRLASSETA